MYIICCYIHSLYTSVYGFHIQNQDDNQLKELLKSNIDKEMKLVVYSAKTQECRG